MDHNVVAGKAINRHESFEKVNGEIDYLADLQFANLAYGMIIRSPYSHARVVSYDTSSAERIRGVLGVLLPEDVPQARFNCSGNPPSALLIKDEKILTNRPLYAGDRIAAVVAESPALCLEAASSIDINYQELPVSLSIEDSLSEKMPPLHPEISATNIAKKIKAESGDIEKGFAESAYIFEREYKTPFVQNAALELTGCVCSYAKDGKLTIWSTSQTPFQERRILSELLQMPESAIRVIKPAMGGGFGSRQQLHNQHVGALLSQKINRPVKIVNSREEDLLASVVRHQTKTSLKFGITKAGYINAVHIKSYFNTGPYASHGPVVVAASSKKFQYKTPNYLFEGYCVYSNSPVGGAMRGYGNPQISFAREAMLNTISNELGFDPVKFRLKNHLEVGDSFPGTEAKLFSCAIKECVTEAERIKKVIDASNPGPASKGTGRNLKESWGKAFACHTSGPSSREGLSSCLVLINDDGSANLKVGSADIGQGSETMLTQLLAEKLGLDFDRVTITAADTLHTPYDTGTYASSQTYVCGNAVCLAAEDVIERLKAALASAFGIAVSQVSHDGRLFIIKGLDQEEKMDFRQAVKKAFFNNNGVVLIGQSSFKAQEAPPPFAVCYAKVLVDLDLKSFKVLDLIQTVDIGTVINPGIVRGQIEGGMDMGIGFALTEEIELNAKIKKAVSTNLLDYKILLAPDMPDLHSVTVKSYEPSGPLGAKSVGELTTIPVAPAIVNAVVNAMGEEITELPLSKRYHRLTGIAHV